MSRKPAVAGQFYSASSRTLLREVQGYTSRDETKARAIGIVSPHAGFMYSGEVAGAVYSRIQVPETFILIGPNHTGLGSPVSIMSSGEWEIPSGVLKVDGDIAEDILRESPVFREDSNAHLLEHSLEVQLPFIYYFSSGVKIVPITMMTGSPQVCMQAGTAIARVIARSGRDVTVVASSDMSHYEEDSVARKKDRMAIDRILSLSPEGLYETVVNEQISMCGFVPATTMLHAARELGAREAVLVKYMTSGDVSGDYSSVVGYAGVIVK